MGECPTCETKGRKVLLGRVGVDAGTLLIADPSYIGSEKGLDWESIMDKLNSGDETREDGKVLRIPYNKGHQGAGVAFESGIGDGVYNVYGIIGDVPGFGRRIKQVVIELACDEKPMGAWTPKRRKR